MVLRRANVGCGSIQPDSWDNFDSDRKYVGENCRFLDITTWSPLREDEYDIIVCSFMLQELDFHQLPEALKNLKSMLRVGGVLRVLVPDIMRAYWEYNQGNERWFPQDSRTGDLDAKFSTYLVWYGTVRSVFTEKYLLTIMRDAFGRAERCRWGETQWGPNEIMQLDSRAPEALIAEAAKW